MTVNTPQAVRAVAATAGPYCIGDFNAVTIEVRTTNGNVLVDASNFTFTGNGMNGNQFTPASAGAGVWTITITPNPGSCYLQTSVQMQVSDQPAATIATPEGPYCASDNTTVQLQGSPVGGKYDNPIDRESASEMLSRMNCQ